jgi:hypothetical protein
MREKSDTWRNRQKLPAEVLIRPDLASRIRQRSSGFWPDRNVGLGDEYELITGAIIVMTGVSDYISDGDVVLKVSNGHELVSAAAIAYTRCTWLITARRHHRVGLYDRYPRRDVLCLGTPASHRYTTSHRRWLYIGARGHVNRSSCRVRVKSDKSLMLVFWLSTSQRR